jgi:hypothetical protein
MTWGVPLLAAAMLAGCATPKHWDKAGATHEDFLGDSHACAREARQSVKLGGISGVSDAQRIDKVVYRACLQARGYQRTNEGTWIGLRD